MQLPSAYGRVSGQPTVRHSAGGKVRDVEIRIGRCLKICSRLLIQKPKKHMSLPKAAFWRRDGAKLVIGDFGLRSFPHIGGVTSHDQSAYRTRSGWLEYSPGCWASHIFHLF